MIRRILLFGATGDLAGRFLLPAMARLQASGYLPDDFLVVGAAREGWDDRAFQRHATQQLERHAVDLDDALRRNLVACLRYRPVDFSDPDSVAGVLGAAQSPRSPGTEPDGGNDRAPSADSSGPTEPVVA